ncbi:DUF4259 domain-containing protein [Streptomyces osmaniensis]|uniref:DUF4259 domain-containing protein n=1 Tax=Streptomyces osmaniensis TaxID=593134 RepID=A0ABP6VTD4_9ACTN|nr:DUF4259 domain-containing protein [Streptomyces sp. JCM17656]
MGTWDIGPFENDTAADFANDLDDAAEGERGTLIRRVLMHTAGNRDYLEAPDAEEAVAAAALIAAQCPGGEPVSPHYGPDEPVPSLPTDLSRLAVEALDRVLADESELSELWGEAEDGRRWRDSIRQMRQVLDPTPQTHGGVLFEV